MKKTMIFLLAAVLLAATAPATQAQKQKSFTAADANEVLQKTAGNWKVGYLMWQPKSKKFLTSEGSASFSQTGNACYVREQFKITRPDGTIEEGEGFLSYSEENKRFELVQINNSGQSTVLMTGKWYPKHRTLLLTPEGSYERWGKQDSKPMQLQYIFLEDGSFLKAVRTPNAKGDYTILSQCHYTGKS